MNKELSRTCDAALRLIAEDIVAGVQCDVSLFEHRNEVRGNPAVCVALNKHVQAIDPDWTVEQIDRARANGVWNSGLPFILKNSKTGEERWLQLGGADPGVATCKRASDEEVLERRASAVESNRRHEQRQQSNWQVATLINTILSKVRARAASMTLTPEQAKDFEYHVGHYSPGGIKSDSISSDTLNRLAAACSVLGTTLDLLMRE